jgi:dipeptidyl aminopeptidase/acylaminoacyl peptidase
MVVSIHGGPASQFKPAWPGASLTLAALAAEGYFVFFRTPARSYGQGEAFTTGNVKDFGYGDLRDILTGVDAVSETAPVDPRGSGWADGATAGS